MKRRLLVIVFICCLLLSVVAPFVRPGVASADPTSASDIAGATFSFQDKNTIVGNFGSTGTVNFVDDNTGDTNYHYSPSGGNFCTPKLKGIGLNLGITLQNNPNFRANTLKAALVLGYSTTTGVKTTCTNASHTITITNQASAAAYDLEWDTNDITTFQGDKNPATFAPATNSTNPNVYIDSSVSANSCGDALVLDTGSTSNATVYIIDSISGIGKSIGDFPNIKDDFPSNCMVINQVRVTIKGQQGTAAPDSGSGATTGSSENLSCSSSTLSWVICPIVDAMVKVIGWVDGIITSQLYVNTNNIFCTNSPNCQAYYNAWQSFEKIALGLLVIAGLVMVMSQALGMEILDAYTVRKALPRLLIAVVGIVLSWPLMKFFIVLSNDLGFGVKDLIEAPFQNLNHNLDLNFSQNSFSNLFFGSALTGIGAVVAIPIWIVAGGIGALLAYAATGALAVLVAVMVLVLRQIAIIFLMLLAPVAIVAYILPNTHNIYKLWWESFSKALLMFPLIVGFIAVGHVFSAISLSNASTAGSTDGALDGIIGFAAYFAPYFMIPMTFRMAGRTMGAVGGFVQSRAQGGFQALNGFRGNQRKSRLERARGRGLYRAGPDATGLQKLGHYANKIGHYSLDLDEQAVTDFGTGSGMGRLLPGRYGKKVGRALFGSGAEEQAGLKARQLVEHNQKAMQDSGLHYTGGYAIKGMRDRFEKDLSHEALDALDTKFGTHEVWDSSHVNDDGTRGAMVKRWNTDKMPSNTDTEGWLAFGQTLEQGSREGSDARKAGEELRTKSGVLTRLGVHPETQRASIRSVASGVLAREGKASPDDMAGFYDEEIEHAGTNPTARAMATAESQHNEALAAQNRHAMRTGKAIRQLQDGTAYNVLGNRPIRDNHGHGNVVLNPDGTEFIPAHSNEAKVNLMTMDHRAGEASKGEIYDDLWEAAIFFGNEGTDAQVEVPTGVLGPDGQPITRTETQRQLTQDAKEIRKNLASQYSSWSQTDPGGKEKLRALLTAMGEPIPGEAPALTGNETAAQVEAMEANEAARRAAEEEEAANH